MRGAFTLLEINDGANNSDVITSLVYEICEFFAKRYQRKGIAMVKNASRVIKEWGAYIRYLIDLTITRDIARVKYIWCW